MDSKPCPKLETAYLNKSSICAILERPRPSAVNVVVASTRLHRHAETHRAIRAAIRRRRDPALPLLRRDGLLVGAAFAPGTARGPCGRNSSCFDDSVFIHDSFLRDRQGSIRNRRDPFLI